MVGIPRGVCFLGQWLFQSLFPPKATLMTFYELYQLDLNLADRSLYEMSSTQFDNRFMIYNSYQLDNFI